MKGRDRREKGGAGGEGDGESALYIRAFLIATIANGHQRE